MSRRVPLAATAILAGMLIAAFWLHGTFDRVLYPIGLQHGECARNGFGATFCGQELTTYRERIQTSQKNVKASQAKLEACARENETITQENEQATIHNSEVEAGTNPGHLLRIKILQVCAP